MNEPTTSKREAIEKLAEEFAARFRRGERPAISEYCTRYPDQAAEIRDLFPALAMIEDVAQGTAAGPTPPHPESTCPAKCPARLGDFRIIREVGRGGMGIVYEAEQLSLGRHVAVKVLIERGPADPRHKGRFEREARAAARLHHTNIVPVYGVGQHEGMQFYVMQFIQGLGLDEVLDELRRMRGGSKTSASLCSAGELRVALRKSPTMDAAQERHSATYEATVDIHDGGDPGGEDATSPNWSSERQLDTAPLVGADRLAVTGTAVMGRLSDTFSLSASWDAAPSPSVAEAPLPPGPRTYWHSIARIGVQVAAALHYAHDQGVLHRDIKPANLLLDLRGTVWVSDFGLARANDQENLTHTQDILGTLRYMPPEAFEGKSDSRSDIYALGLTLYELLSLQPAFSGDDRHSLMKQVTTGDPAPLDRLDRAIPRDLVTIVHKAIDRDAAKRYQTAGAMGADLQRFLDDLPVLARRTSSLERLRRWVGRNRILAAAGSLTTVLLMATAVISFVAYNREAKLASDLANERNAVKFALDAKTTALRQETAARQESREELYRSLLAQARARRLSHEPGRRFQSLAAVAKAAEIHPTAELRNEAIAALALMDVESVRPLEGATLDPYHVAFDQKLNYYAVLERDERLCLRRVSDGQQVATLHIPFPTITSLAALFSPDGNWLVVNASTTAGLTICLYRVAPAEEKANPVWQWLGQYQGFSLDSRRLLMRSANDGPLVWRNLADGEPAGEISIRPGPASASFSPDGQRLALIRQSSLEVLSVADGSVIREWRASEKFDSWPAAWSPDGRFLSAGADDFKVYVWDVDQNRLHSELVGHSLSGIRTAFSPTGEFLVSYGFDRTIRFWNYQQGHPLMSLLGLFYAIDAQSRTMALYNYDEKRIELWRIAGNAAYRTLYHPMIGNPFRSVRRGPRGAGFSRDGRWLAAGSDDGIRIWHTATGVEQLHLPAADCDETVFRPQDGSLISYSRRGVQRWRISAEPGSTPGKPAAEPSVATFRLAAPELIFPRAGGREYNHLSLDAAGRRLIVCDAARQQALVFDLVDGGDPVILGHHPRIRWVDISPDGRYAVTGQWGNGAVRVWDTSTGELLKDWPGDSNLGRFSADSRSLVTLSFSATEAQFWSVGEWQPGRRIECRSSTSHLASFCKTANLMSLSDLNGLRLFNAATVEELATLRLADDREMDSDSCFSPRGDRLAGYGASTIHLWDLGAIRTALRSLRLDWDSPDGLAPPVDDTARLVASAELTAWLSEIGTTGPLTATPVGPGLTPRDLQSNALAIAEERCRKLADSGNWQEAADAYDTLFAAGWPADNMRRLERALLYAWLGRNDALRKFCAAQFRADHQTFWPARCAYLTAEAVDDWGPALRAAEAAIAREPKQPFHWAELGAIQVRAGEFAQAEKSLQRFLDPQFNREHHVYGWFWMSLACLGADRPDEARRWLIKATNWLGAAEKGQPPDEGNGSSARTWWFRLDLRLIQREAEAEFRRSHPNCTVEIK